MDWVIGIAILWFIGWIISKFGDDGGGYGTQIGPLEIRVSDEVTDDGYPFWGVEIRGLIPVYRATNVGVMVSLLDATEGENAPVLTAFEDFQELESRAFQVRNVLGRCEPDQGLPDWCRAAAVPLEGLITARSGHRQIHVVVRLVDAESPPRMQFGIMDEAGPQIFGMQFTTVAFDSVAGYMERSKEELKIAATTVRLAAAIGFADGKFDPKEGQCISDWVRKYLEEIPEGDGREEAKSLLNNSIRNAIQDGAETRLKIQDEVRVLEGMSTTPDRYSAMELCLDVMAADGEADQSELEVLSRVSDALGLDFERFRAMKDKRMMEVADVEISGSDIWTMLDIKPGWSDAEKKKHLNKMYMRWNSRAEALEDGAERDKAHQMLDLIAEARGLLS
jgi:tellurite resistance protein